MRLKRAHLLLVERLHSGSQASCSYHLSTLVAAATRAKPDGGDRAFDSRLQKMLKVSCKLQTELHVCKVHHHQNVDTESRERSIKTTAVTKIYIYRIHDSAKRQFPLQLLEPREVEPLELTAEEREEWTRRNKEYSRHKMQEHREWQKVVFTVDCSASSVFCSSLVVKS